MLEGKLFRLKKGKLHELESWNSPYERKKSQITGSTKCLTMRALRILSIAYGGRIKSLLS